MTDRSSQFWQAHPMELLAGRLPALPAGNRVRQLLESPVKSLEIARRRCLFLLRLMSSYPIAFCDFLDGHQIGCGSEVADAIFFLQHRPHLLKGFTHGVIET